MKTLLIEKINEELKEDFTEREIFFSETIDLSKKSIHVTERQIQYLGKDITIRLRWFSPPKKGDKGSIIWNFYNDKS